MATGRLGQKRNVRNSSIRHACERTRRRARRSSPLACAFLTRLDAIRLRRHHCAPLRTTSTRGATDPLSPTARRDREREFRPPSTKITALRTDCPFGREAPLTVASTTVTKTRLGSLYALIDSGVVQTGITNPPTIQPSLLAGSCRPDRRRRHRRLTQPVEPTRHIWRNDSVVGNRMHATCDRREPKAIRCSPAPLSTSVPTRANHGTATNHAASIGFISQSPPKRLLHQQGQLASTGAAIDR